MVRFILPIQASSRPFADSVFVPTDLDPIDDDEPTRAAVAAEMHALRALFFVLFVEAVVRTIKGEDEIWLLERGTRDRLYRWVRALT